MKKDRIASGKNQMLKLVGQSMMRSGVLPKYLPTKILTNYNRQISTFTLDNSADSTPPNWSRLTPPVMIQIDIITSWNNVPAVRYSCQHASTLVINRKTQRGGTFYFLKCQGHRRRGEKREKEKNPQTTDLGTLFCSRLKESKETWWQNANRDTGPRWLGQVLCYGEH